MNLMVTGGTVEGRDRLGIWDRYVHTILYLKYITNKDLLYSPGNSAQYSLIT